MKFVRTELNKKNKGNFIDYKYPDKQEMTPNGFLIDPNDLDNCMEDKEEAKKNIINRVKKYR